MRALPTTLALLLVAACGDDPNSLLPGAGRRGSRTSQTTDSTDSTTGPATPGATSSSSSSSSGGNPDPVACKPGLTSVSLSLTPSPDGPVRATVTSDGGTLVAWGGNGQVHVRRVDGAGANVGADRTVAGNTVHGIAAMPNAVALLVSRSPDVLVLVKIGDAGDVQLEKPLLGNVNHDTVGSEWFDFQPFFFQEAGRLVWSGSKLFIYVPIFRRWPDGIAHTGDQLRVLDANGNPAAGESWAWGCSHSLDVRLSPDGETPVCLSDCLPQKGVLRGRNSFGFQPDVISTEPSGTCGGSSNAQLGGLTSVGGASWLTFASREGRSSRDIALVKLGDPTKHFLTQGGEASAPHLAAFGQGMVAGWRVGNTSSVQRLDAQGNPVGTPEDVSSLPFGESDDFLSWPGGDAGWLSASGAGLKIARLGACK